MRVYMKNRSKNKKNIFKYKDQNKITNFKLFLNLFLYEKLTAKKKEDMTTTSIVPKLGRIVWGGKGVYTHRGKHDKINFIVTVIPVAVRQRVKYEQKSRHRYRVYANSLGGIDEHRDVTANIRFPHLSYCRIHIHTYIYTHTYTHIHIYMYSAAFTRSAALSAFARFASARFVRDSYNLRFSNIRICHAPASISVIPFIMDPLSFSRSCRCPLLFFVMASAFPVSLSLPSSLSLLCRNSI